MSEALDLLNDLSEGTPYTAQPETEGHIVIGEDRFITVPEGLKRIAVQHDHNIETVTFDCPRYWDEHDMSQMRVYVNYQRPDGVTGSCLCEEVWVDENDENLMHFNWTVGGHVTAEDGKLLVQVCIKKLKSGDGLNETEINHWNSEINEEMYISKGLDCSLAVPTNQPTQTKLLYCDENGSYTMVPDDGFVLDKVNVEVSVPEVGRASTTEQYTENGRYVITPPDDGCLLERVTVVVDVDATQKTTKMMEEYRTNDVYTIKPPDGYLLEEVTVVVEVDSGAEPEPIAKSDVTFYDYDGTVVAAYTTEEASELTELPTPPTHEGLTFQGWNYEIETVKTYCRRLNVGALYITDDGKTRFYITVDPGTGGEMQMTFDSERDGGTVTVDWGDGSEQDVYSTASDYVITHHVYSSPGNYCVTVWPNEGHTLKIGSGASGFAYGLSASRIRRVELGEGAALSDYSFDYVTTLETITIPAHIDGIPSYCFEYCTSLAHITVPMSATYIGECALYCCYSLRGVSLPEGVARLEQFSFQGSSLREAIVPEGTSTIAQGAFGYVYPLSFVQMPSTLETIEMDAFVSDTPYVYDCRACAAVPSLVRRDAIVNGSYILVPENLLAEWKAATNWSSHASYIVSSI